MSKNFGNYAIDTCLAANREGFSPNDFEGVEIKYVRPLGRVFVAWLGYSFSCSYSRNAISVETIGL